MPYKKMSAGGGRVKVMSPHGIKARATTPAKAEAQMRLLRGIEHGWRPKGIRK